MAKEEYDYAGLGDRFLALLIDMIILFLISIPLIFIAALTSIPIGIMGGPFAFTTAFWIFISVIELIYLLYFTILEGTGGQTLGKMVLNTKVVGYDGKPIGFLRAFIRNLLRIIDGIALYLIGAILVLVTDKKQRLGDMAARDVVIKLKKQEKFRPEEKAA